MNPGIKQLIEDINKLSIDDLKELLKKLNEDIGNNMKFDIDKRLKEIEIFLTKNKYEILELALNGILEGYRDGVVWLYNVWGNDELKLRGEFYATRKAYPEMLNSKNSIPVCVIDKNWKKLIGLGAPENTKEEIEYFSNHFPSILKDTMFDIKLFLENYDV